jgi:hypothetical protein
MPYFRGYGNMAPKSGGRSLLSDGRRTGPG